MAEDDVQAQPAPRKTRVKTLPVKILRGYWPEDGSDPLPPGTETELPAAEALNIIALGVAERNDALPGV